METKSLRERAEEARVEAEEILEGKEKERRSGVVADAISYFSVYFPEVKYNTDRSKFELDGEFFSFQSDGVIYDLACQKPPKTTYRLFPGDYSNFFLGFSDMAGYGQYLKDKEEKEKRETKPKGPAVKVGSPSKWWWKLL